MKLQNIKEKVLTELAKKECLQQYKISKTDFSLKKTNKEIKIKIGFTNNHWIDEIHLFPSVKIEHNCIHRICEKFGFNLNYTAFINLFVLEKVVKGEYTEDTRWKLQYDQKDRFVLFSEDISYMMVRMNQLLVYAMDYINENSTIAAIDKLYNENPTYKYNPNSSGMNTHCAIGLIAAKLSGNPNFSEIANIYSNILNNDPDTFLKEDIDAFNRIKEYLTNM